jgi:hypothetical protein
MQKRDSFPEIARIARRVLRVSTLERRGTDDADIHEVAVWELREALAAAYAAGRTSR